MTDRKLAWIAGGLAVLAILIVLFRPAKNIIQQVSTGEPINVGAASPALGSWFSVGDVETWGSNVSLIQASSTGVICAIQSPNATSSLQFGAVSTKTSTTSATKMTFAKSSSPSATTTILGGQMSIAAGNQGNYVASSTSIFGPKSWFVVSLEGGAGSSGLHAPVYRLTGACSAVWNRITY